MRVNESYEDIKNPILLAIKLIPVAVASNAGLDGAKSRAKQYFGI